MVTQVPDCVQKHFSKEYDLKQDVCTQHLEQNYLD